MGIDFVRLETIEHARALARCVYDVYGLTFHRSYLYEPETSFALNQKGHVESFLAMDGKRCVGHVAAIRPYYEYTIAGTPVASDEIREIGLYMVVPELQGRGILNQLRAEVTRWSRGRERRGLYTRCVTHHTRTQRVVREVANPTALFLAGVPYWVRYEADDGERGNQPISTISYYTSLRDGDTREVFLPDIDRDVFQAIYERLGESRALRKASEGPSAGTPTRLRVHFDPAKHQGRIHVLRAGPDVEELVTHRFRWLMGGRIRHVLVIAPLDNPFVARAATAWKGEGGRELDLHPGEIQVIDPLSSMLRNRALEDWRFARDIGIAPTGFDGLATPGAVL
jgi:hypothetical protein